MPGDWLATNIWLDSTDCTLQRGVWLAVCENGRMIPISERALADDPGHALLLEMWSAATGRRATLVDAARLNTLLNVVGTRWFALFDAITDSPDPTATGDPADDGRGGATLTIPRCSARLTGQIVR